MGSRDDSDEEHDEMQDTMPASPTPVRQNKTSVPVAPSSAPSSSSVKKQQQQNRQRDYPSPTSSPHKRRIVYGDRYIPSRSGVNLQAAFSLVKDQISNPKPRRPASNELDFQRVEEANRTFSTLLKAELFGNDVPSAAVGASQQPTNASSSSKSSNDSTTDQTQTTPPRTSRSAPVTPNKNLFRYQTPSRSIPPRGDACYTDGRSFSRTRGIADACHDIYSLSPVRMDSQRLLLSPKKQLRSVAKVPYKVLDAPELADDFYLNLVDWSSKNLLGVGLSNSVYLWHAQSGVVNKLCDLNNDDKVTSISWMKQGTHLAVGTNQGLVEIWDVEESKKIRTMTGHTQRAGSLAWNEHLLTSGSRDRSILHRDVRVAEHFIKKLTGHRQEVCGLRWNPEETQLASGSNDNRLFVWDGMNDTPTFKFDHIAAVKALAWSPHQRGILASGGGTADRRIRFWNTINGQHLNEIDTGSQVCNLAWSKNSNELVSTHGYSQNQVMVWKYPSMQQVAALTGHTYRVLYLAVSPDGRTVVTGAGDETLRFWNVFDGQKSNHRQTSSLLDVYQQLR